MEYKVCDRPVCRCNRPVHKKIDQKRSTFLGYINAKERLSGKMNDPEVCIRLIYQEPNRKQTSLWRQTFCSSESTINQTAEQTAEDSTDRQIESEFFFPGCKAFAGCAFQVRGGRCKRRKAPINRLDRLVTISSGASSR